MFKLFTLILFININLFASINTSKEAITVVDKLSIYDLRKTLKDLQSYDIYVEEKADKSGKFYYSIYAVNIPYAAKSKALYQLKQVFPSAKYCSTKTAIRLSNKNNNNRDIFINKINSTNYADIKIEKNLPNDIIITKTKVIKKDINDKKIIVPKEKEIVKKEIIVTEPKKIEIAKTIIPTIKDTTIIQKEEPILKEELKIKKLYSTVKPTTQDNSSKTNLLLDITVNNYLLYITILLSLIFIILLLIYIQTFATKKEKVKELSEL